MSRPPETLEEFLGGCVSAADDDTALPDSAVVMCDDAPEPGILCVRVGEANQFDIQRMFGVKQRRFAGWASLTGWAPDDVSPIKDSWIVLAVEGEFPAMAAVRNLDDPKWTLVRPLELPWMYAATAGAMRGWLHGDFLAPLKFTTDRRLFKRVGEDEPPPVDEHGRI